MKFMLRTFHSGACPFQACRSSRFGTTTVRGSERPSELECSMERSFDGRNGHLIIHSSLQSSFSCAAGTILYARLQLFLARCHQFCKISLLGYGNTPTNNHVDWYNHSRSRILQYHLGSCGTSFWSTPYAYGSNSCYNRFQHLAGSG
jgi:hypothetical protein